MAINLLVYTLIPTYVRRSGATLFNISNVTTVIWSMLSDILIFNGKFYPLYLCAFTLEMMGVVLFTLQKPITKEEREE